MSKPMKLGDIDLTADSGGATGQTIDNMSFAFAAEGGGTATGLSTSDLIMEENGGGSYTVRVKQLTSEQLAALNPGTDEITVT